MQPYSYTGVKIIHEQNIQDAMRRNSQPVERQARQPRRRRVFGLLLARLQRQPVQNCLSEQVCSGALPAYQPSVRADCC